jgi:hypothetical protein
LHPIVIRGKNKTSKSN